MMVKLIDWIASLWRRFLTPKEDSTANLIKLFDCPKFKAQMDESLEQWKQKAAEERLATRKAALAAAEAGEGPQPWDRDWYEHNPDVSNDVYEIGLEVGWHWCQEFLEVLDWAVASPQGQRALALAGDPNNPLQGPLDVITNVREALLDASHRLLRQEAEELNCPNDWCEGLEALLHARRQRGS